MLLCYDYEKGGDPMRKHPEVTEQTKANLRTAFWSLYKEKAIEKITIKEITDAAGYNRGTFYLYYKDVYDLFNKIEEELLEEIRILIHDNLPQKEGLDFAGHMGLIVKLSQQYSAYMSVLLSDHGDPTFVTRLKELIWPLLNRYVLDTSALTTQEQSLLSEFYLSGLLAAITRWLEAPGDMTIDQFIRFVMRQVFSGVVMV